jgi:hypothetical protein
VILNIDDDERAQREEDQREYDRAHGLDVPAVDLLGQPRNGTLAPAGARVESPTVPAGTVGRMRFVLASEVKITRPRQVWKDRIPVGGVTIFAGMEGQGKSAFTAHLMARLTRGQLDGEYRGTPVDVLYVGLEDDRGAIIVPRLTVAGADLDRVRFLDLDDGGVFSASYDLTELDRMLTDWPGVRLVVIDPVDSHLGERVDTHRKSDTQAVFGRIAELAQRHGIGVLAIAHLNKGDSGELLRRVVGSVGFTTSARSVLGVGAHPDDEADRVVVLAKSNYVDKSMVKAIRYRVEGQDVASDDGPINAASVVWLGEETGIDPNSIVSTLTHADRTERDDAADWLNDLLGDGPMSYKDVEKAAAEDGISRATLHRAKKLVGIDIARDLNTRGRPSTWSLSSHTDSSHTPCDTGETKSKEALNRADNPPNGVSSHEPAHGNETLPEVV